MDLESLADAEIIIARHAGTVRTGRLRFIGSSSAALPPRELSDLEEVFGVPVVEAYGMTEAAHRMACNPLRPGDPARRTDLAIACSSA